MRVPLSLISVLLAVAPFASAAPCTAAAERCMEKVPLGGNDGYSRRTVLPPGGAKCSHRARRDRDSRAGPQCRRLLLFGSRRSADRAGAGNDAGGVAANRIERRWHLS